MNKAVADFQKMNTLWHDVRWNAVGPFAARRIPMGLKDWVLDKGSLTQRLVEAYNGDFSVKVLDQAWQSPTRSELAVLGLCQRSRCFIRHVHLYCAGSPKVFARTVIPVKVASGRLRGLTHLGNKPLGAVLFSSSHMRRGAFEIAEIMPDSWLHMQATQDLVRAKKSIWGRRSIFYLYNQPLLVNEIFLPGFSD